jgi:rhamnosyltransferase subunit B
VPGLISNHNINLKIMSKIVFTTLGSLGDLYPQIALAIELRQRGHDIAFAVMQEYGEIVASLGFEFWLMRPDSSMMKNPETLALMKDTQTGPEYGFKHWLAPSLRDTYTDLLASAKDADLIIAGDAVFAAPLVSEKLGIPWVAFALAPFSFFSIADPSVTLLKFLDKLRELGRPLQTRMIPLVKGLTKHLAEPIYQLRAELGLSQISHNPLEEEFSSCMILGSFSPVLAAPQPDWDPRIILTGFIFYDGTHQNTELSAELQAFLAAGEPPIVFTLGTIVVGVPGTFYQESIQAATLLNRRAVLLIGSNTPPANLPESMIAIDYVRHSVIFPHACAIVHQGGAGTTAQALKSGHPTLIVPYCDDQPDNAARMERLGTSLTISRQDYKAARVAQELEILLDRPEYAVKAAAVAQIIQAEDGVNLACDAIIKQLAS